MCVCVFPLHTLFGVLAIAPHSLRHAIALNGAMKDCELRFLRFFLFFVFFAVSTHNPAFCENKAFSTSTSLNNSYFYGRKAPRSSCWIHTHKPSSYSLWLQTRLSSCRLLHTLIQGAPAWVRESAWLLQSVNAVFPSWKAPPLCFGRKLAVQHSLKLSARSEPSGLRVCRLLNWSNRVIPYLYAWNLQNFLNTHQGNKVKAVANKDISGATSLDFAMLLQHPPVYTLGQSAGEGNIIGIQNAHVKDLTKCSNFEVFDHLLEDLCATHKDSLPSSTSLKKKPSKGVFSWDSTLEDASSLFSSSAEKTPPFHGLSSSSGPERPESCTLDKGVEASLKNSVHAHTHIVPPKHTHMPIEPPHSTPSTEIFRVERGGDITFHAPGQLVLYPILDLRHQKQDLHWYLRSLEEVVISTLARFGIKACRREGLTGVWVGERKICAEGVKVSRWITMHGIALNVCVNLGGFEKIIPCGIKGGSVCSMNDFVEDVHIGGVAEVLVEEFARIFKLRIESYEDVGGLV